MTTARRVPLADQAAEALLQRVRGGEWAVGAKLPGETTLAPQLGVGRSTVREAIRQLAGRGVLATRQGSGVFVAALDVVDGFADRVSRADVAAVLEARLAVEVESSGLAAHRRTDEDVLAMRSALADRERAADPAYVAADTAFHRSIVAAAHNPVLLDLFDGFAPRSSEAMTAMVRASGHHRTDADQVEHGRLLQAVVDGDAAEAARRTRVHLQALLDGLP